MAAAAKYPVELKERAVALVRERQREGRGRGVIAQVARDLVAHPEALRHWLAQDDAGRRPWVSGWPGSESDKDARINELERRVRELERANSILKAAASFSRRKWTRHRRNGEVRRRVSRRGHFAAKRGSGDLVVRNPGTVRVTGTGVPKELEGAVAHHSHAAERAFEAPCHAEWSDLAQACGPPKSAPRL